MIQSIAVYTWPDPETPTPAAILEHPTKPRQYVYICSRCGGNAYTYTALERGPVLCVSCGEREG